MLKILKEGKFPNLNVFLKIPRSTSASACVTTNVPILFGAKAENQKQQTSPRKAGK